MAEDFESRLKALRSRFVENFPQNEADKEAQIAAFNALSTPEKLHKVKDILKLLAEKKEILAEKLAATADSTASTEIQEHLDLIGKKQELFQHKLELIESGAYDSVKREKLKRQLTQLEMKRCKSIFDKKDCNKINLKIAQKKEQFKKIFT